MNDALTSEKVKAALWIIGAVIALLLAFGLGMAIGYRKAIFASYWGENYYRNFSAGPPPGGAGGPIVMMRTPFNLHGVTGEVIDKSTSTMAVRDQFGNEQAVVPVAGAQVRGVADDTAATSIVGWQSIPVGAWITAIGAPNANGQIEARFIRMFPSSSSLPVDFN